MEYMLAVSRMVEELAMVSLMRFQRLWKGTDCIDRKFDETKLKTVGMKHHYGADLFFYAISKKDFLEKFVK